jgi:hypothetical protein
MEVRLREEAERARRRAAAEARRQRERLHAEMRRGFLALQARRGRGRASGIREGAGTGEVAGRRRGRTLESERNERGQARESGRDEGVGGRGTAGRIWERRGVRAPCRAFFVVRVDKIMCACACGCRVCACARGCRIVRAARKCASNSDVLLQSGHRANFECSEVLRGACSFSRRGRGLRRKDQWKERGWERGWGGHRRRRSPSRPVRAARLALTPNRRWRRRRPADPVRGAAAADGGAAAGCLSPVCAK